MSPPEQFFGRYTGASIATGITPGSLTIREVFAGVAQLIERNLAKVEVASLNLVPRSIRMAIVRAKDGVRPSFVRCRHYCGVSLSRPVAWPVSRAVAIRMEFTVLLRCRE